MGYIKLSIGQVGITDHLLINIRKTTDPLVIYDSQSFPPPVSATINFIFANIDPDVYFVDYRESPDGVALGTLLGTFTVDAATNMVLAETRYYLVGSGLNNAPNGGDTDLIDPYLDGKNIFAVYTDGLGRPFVPPSETFKEYDLIPGGGISLLNGLTWGDQAVIAVQISYSTPVPSVGSGGRFTSVVTIDSNTTLNNTHYDKRLRCEAAASNRLVVTMDDLLNVPDGKAFKFMSNQGTQFITKLLPAPGDLFRYHETDYTEFWVWKGSSFIVEKRVIGSDAFWEIYDGGENALLIGRPEKTYWKDHANMLVRDGALYDGDDYPSLYWWLRNKLPIGSYISDATVGSGGYVHPTNRRGQFVIHPTLKLFRVPNSLNLSERNIKALSGTDAERTINAPGGIQLESVKKPAQISGQDITGVVRRVGAGGQIDGWNAGGGNAPGSDNYNEAPWPYQGIETRPENEAMIPMVRY